MFNHENLKLKIFCVKRKQKTLLKQKNRQKTFLMMVTKKTKGGRVFSFLDDLSLNA